LVVVLIIGILASVALPKYKMAVAKSRYAAVKNTVRSIAAAEEVYYMSNNAYTDDFTKLDIDKPISTNITCGFDGGGREIKCSHKKLLGIVYKIDLAYSPTGDTWCVAGSTDLSDFKNQFCKAETRASSPADIGDYYMVWVYRR
jgi:type II secretory pathway pseudopilin PulG